MKFKRLLCTFLSLCLLTAMVPLNVQAEEVASGVVSARDGDFTWKFADGALYLTGNGYCIDDCPWTHLLDQIESIQFSGSLTIIGKVFSQMPNLKEITMPSGVTQISYAFNDCFSLESVSIPNTVTKILDSFNRCFVLSDLKLSSKLTLISSSFQHTSCLTQVTLPTSLTSISGSFIGSGLVTLSIPASLKNLMYSSFDRCFYLKEVCFLGSAPELTSGAFDSVTATAYYSWSRSSWTEEVRTAIGPSMTWKGVSNPASVKMEYDPYWSIHDGVLTITGSGALKEEIPWSGANEQVEKIVIKEGVTTIPEDSFYYTTNLVSVSLPKSLQRIGMQAFDRSALPSIVIPANVTEIGEMAFMSCENLEKIILPDKITHIEQYTFHSCRALSEVSLPKNLKTIGSAAFMACTSLKSITIPAATQSIDNYAFGSCSNLTDITFDGDAPNIADSAFSGVTATVYYYLDNPTWTPDVMQNYGGSLTWVPLHDHRYAGAAAEYDAATHTHTMNCTVCGEPKTEACAFTDVVLEEATPETFGMKRYTCTVCGGTYEGHYVYRIAGENRFETAFKVADQMKENLGIEKFDAVIIASGANFADALSGSYLASVKNAPILLSYKAAQNEQVQAYIKANLAEGGTVYILGGTSAVPADMESGLAGINVVRLDGANRFETNLMILKEAGVREGQEILVCTSTNFADSLSASATGLPILLVYNEKSRLTDDQLTYLGSLSGNSFRIIGGENAVSSTLEAAIAAYGSVNRLAGANRFETSVMVAETYFDAPDYAVLAYAWNYPDGLCGGPLAYTMDAPLVLTMTKYEAAAAEYIEESGIERGIVLGGTGLISDDAVRTIFPNISKPQ